MTEADTLAAIAEALERAAAHLEEAAAVVGADARELTELVHRLALEEPPPEVIDRLTAAAAEVPASGYPWRIGYRPPGE